MSGDLWNPHVVRQRGAGWTVDAAPGRWISVGREGDWFPQAVGLRDPDAARALAAALLRAADVAEQPGPVPQPAVNP